MYNVLLDILKLIKPVHDGQYLVKKLVKVINRLQITCFIIFITRDNASPNNSILDEFKAMVAK
jgi:hypothetical protein